MHTPMPKLPTLPQMPKMRPQAMVTLAVGLVAAVLMLAYRGGAFAAMNPQQAPGQTRVAAGSLGAAQATAGALGFQSRSDAYGLGPQASAVVKAAMSQVGGRYANYGDTPKTGFSCVGLVHWSFAQVGLNVPESAPALATAYPTIKGATPDGAHLVPGDILLFQNTAWAGYSHASIYVGGGKMVSADSYETGIRLESFNTPYWVQHWAGAVRVPALVQDMAPTTAP